MLLPPALAVDRRVPARPRGGTMKFFKPGDWWDWSFQVGIVLKGLIGVAELVSGLLLLFMDPVRIHRLAVLVTRHEISEDPRDFIANYLRQASEHLTGNALLFGSIYLLLHGAVKAVLVAALLLNKLWAYPWMIGMLIAFIAYQIYMIAVTPTAVLIALTLFDALLVVLTWHEYRRQRVRHAQ